MTDLHGQLELAMRLVVALVLGAAIGLEREYRQHPAGLRTMALVAVGSALFSAVGVAVVPSADSTRIAAQVVTGIGFLGAGAILRHGDNVRGLTTAASIWVAAAIGMASGFGLYWLALSATALALVALVIVGWFESDLTKRSKHP